MLSLNINVLKQVMNNMEQDQLIPGINNFVNLYNKRIILKNPMGNWSEHASLGATGKSSGETANSGTTPPRLCLPVAWYTARALVT